MIDRLFTQLNNYSVEYCMKIRAKIFVILYANCCTNCFCLFFTLILDFITNTYDTLIVQYTANENIYSIYSAPLVGFMATDFRKAL